MLARSLSYISSLQCGYILLCLMLFRDLSRSTVHPSDDNSIDVVWILSSTVTCFTVVSQSHSSLYLYTVSPAIQSRLAPDGNASHFGILSFHFKVLAADVKGVFVVIS